MRLGDYKRERRSLTSGKRDVAERGRTMIKKAIEEQSLTSDQTNLTSAAVHKSHRFIGLLKGIKKLAKPKKGRQRKPSAYIHNEHTLETDDKESSIEYVSELDMAESRSQIEAADTDRDAPRDEYTSKFTTKIFDGYEDQLREILSIKSSDTESLPKRRPPRSEWASLGDSHTVRISISPTRAPILPVTSSEIDMLSAVLESRDEDAVSRNASRDHRGDADSYSHGSTSAMSVWTACRTGDMDLVQETLSSSPELLNKVKNGRTLLYHACHTGNVDLATFLLKCGAKDIDGTSYKSALNDQIRKLLTEYGQGKPKKQKTRSPAPKIDHNNNNIINDTSNNATNDNTKSKSPRLPPLHTSRAKKAKDKRKEKAEGRLSAKDDKKLVHVDTMAEKCNDMSLSMSDGSLQVNSKVDNGRLAAVPSPLPSSPLSPSSPRSDRQEKYQTFEAVIQPPTVASPLAHYVSRAKYFDTNFDLARTESHVSRKSRGVDDDDDLSETFVRSNKIIDSDSGIYVCPSPTYLSSNTATTETLKIIKRDSSLANESLDDGIVDSRVENVDSPTKAKYLNAADREVEHIKNGCDIRSLTTLHCIDDDELQPKTSSNAGKDSMGDRKLSPTLEEMFALTSKTKAQERDVKMDQFIEKVSEIVQEQKDQTGETRRKKMHVSAGNIKAAMKRGKDKVTNKLKKDKLKSKATPSQDPVNAQAEVTNKKTGNMKSDEAVATNAAIHQQLDVSQADKVSSVDKTNTLLNDVVADPALLSKNSITKTNVLPPTFSKSNEKKQDTVSNNTLSSKDKPASLADIKLEHTKSTPYESMLSESFLVNALLHDRSPSMSCNNKFSDIANANSTNNHAKDLNDTSAAVFGKAAKATNVEASNDMTKSSSQVGYITSTDAVKCSEDKSPLLVSISSNLSESLSYLLSHNGIASAKSDCISEPNDTPRLTTIEGLTQYGKASKPLLRQSTLEALKMASIDEDAAIENNSKIPHTSSSISHNVSVYNDVEVEVVLDDFQAIKSANHRPELLVARAPSTMIKPKYAKRRAEPVRQLEFIGNGFSISQSVNLSVPSPTSTDSSDSSMSTRSASQCISGDEQECQLTASSLSSRQGSFYQDNSLADTGGGDFTVNTESSQWHTGNGNDHVIENITEMKSLDSITVSYSIPSDAYTYSVSSSESDDSFSDKSSTSPDDDDDDDDDEDDEDDEDDIEEYTTDELLAHIGNIEDTSLIREISRIAGIDLHISTSTDGLSVAKLSKLLSSKDEPIQILTERFSSHTDDSDSMDTSSNFGQSLDESVTSGSTDEASVVDTLDETTLEGSTLCDSTTLGGSSTIDGGSMVDVATINDDEATKSGEVQSYDEHINMCHNEESLDADSGYGASFDETPGWLCG